MRQFGIYKNQLLEIGYEKKEMVQDLKKSMSECCKLGYALAQIREEESVFKTEWSCIQTFEWHTRTVYSVIALPDGQSLTSGSHDQQHSFTVVLILDNSESVLLIVYTHPWNPTPRAQSARQSAVWQPAVYRYCKLVMLISSDQQSITATEQSHITCVIDCW